MLPAWVKRLGPQKLIFLLTVLSALVSVAISCGLRLLLEGRIYWVGTFIALAVPVLLTPVIGAFFVHILFDLDAAKAQLALLSVTDDLTQVYNRRYFIGRARYELARAQRYGHVFSMLLIDVDDFKQINDEHGHPAGDELLCLLADVCLRESREVDVLARLGGDEFGFLIPGLQQAEAVRFADRLRQILGESRLAYHGKQLQASVSVGVITWTPAVENFEALIFLMDKALYAAKRGGKNKTVVADLGNSSPTQ
jgi:diguanylate cyclase (GGDEF)-like protein